MTRTVPPLIIATLPARTLNEAREQIASAVAAGADLAEIRFDRWEAPEVGRMAELFPSALPLLATLRSKADGGEGPDAAEPRREWFRRAIALPFTWVDVESARDTEWVRREPAPSGRPRLVESVHLDAPPSTADLHRRLVQEGSPAAIVKVVVVATVRAALRIVLPAVPEVGEAACIVHTTGPSGALFRAWSKRLGLAGVFGRLPSNSDSASAPVEPTQIPVDRLRRFFDAGGTSPIFAIVGHPVAHSLSPEFHDTWMRRGDRNGLYIALDIEDESEFVDSIEALAAGGFLGVNVTHPLKEIALAVATRASPRATACGCANMLTFDGDEIEADNTDLIAVVRRLKELGSDGVWDQERLVVLGSGGAARAALAAAQVLGTRATILARDAGASTRLASMFQAESAVSPPQSAPALVIHATTVGRAADSRLDFNLHGWIGPGTYCLDFVYRAAGRSVEDQVRSAGGRYEDGRRLLAYAAAASYERWWGASVEPQWVEDALAEAA